MYNHIYIIIYIYIYIIIRYFKPQLDHQNWPPHQISHTGPLFGRIKVVGELRRGHRSWATIFIGIPMDGNINIMSQLVRKYGYNLI